MNTKIIQFFKHPYPFYENMMQAFKLGLGIGFFIGFFCYLFRPFGLEHATDIQLLGFGLVSFLVCGFYMMLLPLVFPNILSHRKWKIYKEILWILLITSSIATANYFYLGFIFDAGYAFNLRIFVFVLTSTAIIAVIPAIAIILYKQVFVYKRIVKEVEKIDAKLVSRNSLFIEDESKIRITFKSDTRKNDVHVFLDQFVFLSSFGNYIEVYYLKNNELTKQLIRNTISNVEKDLKEIKSIVRCHRSHMINLQKIDRVKGNLQGYQLFFKVVDMQIPVSRSYTRLIKEAVLN
ncbi:LytTR family DNA-binding domain-containing protein [Flavobacteriaceae bacterium S356]|uniref:LytTR family DNA-binding domain-containing protein n=1 Tax=Asprobacillus argus TaxID=3076534 RepID=A0ABU3LIL6_9FLAO|nr:LytTR family DNA-binding domain-containing protein [Flavobacteriaceae bacterium S356]